MEDTPTHKERIPRESPVFNVDLYLTRCQALGAITQDLQAELFGITQANVSRMCRSKQVPRVDTALRVSRALDVPIEDLWPVAS